MLDLNERFVELLAPMDAERLAALVGLADRACVIVHEGAFAGFVITMGAGAAYDSANYAWFAERHLDFYYLDRVVLAPHARRIGLGSRVYDVLEARAAERAPVFALEVNVEPPNEPSLAFHLARGFAEVGRLAHADHTSAMLLKRLR